MDTPPLAGPIYIGASLQLFQKCPIFLSNFLAPKHSPSLLVGRKDRGGEEEKKKWWSYPARVHSMLSMTFSWHQHTAGFPMWQTSSLFQTHLIFKEPYPFSSEQILKYLNSILWPFDSRKSVSGFSTTTLRDVYNSKMYFQRCVCVYLYTKHTHAEKQS